VSVLSGTRETMVNKSSSCTIPKSAAVPSLLRQNCQFKRTLMEIMLLTLPCHFAGDPTLS
jgi:hypothetical protein